LADQARVLLTGASGFIGRHAIGALLERGAEVHAVGRSAAAGYPCTWHQADLLAPGAPQQVIAAVRPDIVLHLAWCVEHGKFWTDPANLDWIAATLALARASAEHGVRRFVGVGTCFEYDWPDEGPCLEAETPLAGHTLYDRAKAACRSVLTEFFGQAGLSFAWARLFFLYGPDEAPNRLVASIARALVHGEPARTSSGRAIRDFIDTRDAGAALAALALAGAAGEVNIATGEAHSVREIAKLLGDIVRRPDLVEIGALPDREEPPYIVGSSKRLRDEVGFAPQITLEQGLADAIAFWRGRQASP
jgi:nucleoside-diphosphate-sugar epimerase